MNYLAEVVDSYIKMIESQNLFRFDSKLSKEFQNGLNSLNKYDKNLVLLMCEMVDDNQKAIEEIKKSLTNPVKFNAWIYEAVKRLEAEAIIQNEFSW